MAQNGQPAAEDDPPKKSSVRLTDEEIIQALHSEEALAVDSRTGELARERADAINRYRGAPLGNEVEGRSQVVDRSIMDTIEWIMPSLARIFLGGDQIGKFDPIGPQDEDAAETETDVCNWYLENKSDLFSQITATLKDALLLKNGYMVGYWEKKTDEVTETYIGQSDEEAALLSQDEDVEVIEHTEYPDPSWTPPPPQMMVPGQPPQPAPQAPMLHDLKVQMKKADEFPAVESVPPDELLVTRRQRWTSLMDCPFVEWVRRNVTIGELRAEGFDIPDDEPFDDASTMEGVARDRFGQNQAWDRQDNTNDPSRRVVTFRDAYMRIDLRGAGTPQLWRFARVSGSPKLALKEEANIIPFAAFSPIIFPHSHTGMSIYDLIVDLGDIKTALQRQGLDGIYLQNSGRVGVDITKVTNLDDLLVSRPGGIVRFEGNPNECMAPFQQPDTSQAVLGMLEFVESQKEGRTGVTRYSAGLDANTLNKTATGIQSIQQAANTRIEMIARTLASGFKDLFLIIHALASKYSTKALQIKLNGKWVAVDPRAWKKRTDFSISVGLGTGTPEQQLQKLMGLSPVFQQGMQMGLAGPEEAYNFGKEIWKAAGYKVPDRFIHPPPMAPKMGPNGQPVIGPDGKPVMEPQLPPPQKPELVQAAEVKAQADTQIAMAKHQADQQTAAIKAQADQQVQQARANADMQVQQHKINTDAIAEVEKTKVQLALDNMKHGREQQTAIEIAKINANAKIIAAQIAAQQATGMAGAAADSAYPSQAQ